MTKRFKLRFPSNESMNASQAIEMPEATPVVANPKRNYISVAVPDVPADITGARAVRAGVERAPSLAAMAERFGAEIVEDYQYDLEVPEFSFEAAATTASGSLPEVTRLNGAEKAWACSTGKGATIAIVDTGIDGTHPEFPAAKRAGSWEPIGDTPWTDWEGHGTMCATIAAASDAAPGSRYRGVAPDARLIACKTQFFDSELGAIYDFLIAQAAELEGPLIASNSFGRRTGSPPAPPSDSDFIAAMNDAIDAGVIVFFSAGNNHQLAGGAPAMCSPNSVWLHKSRADVYAVATCDLDKAMWFYSSRGPGQHFGDPGTSKKPDVTAPTPRNGRILYGDGERVLANGWGTSGACPQAAGLAALLVSADAALDRQKVFDAIRGNTVSLGHGDTCEGTGLIDCNAAVADVMSALVA